jgi:hypothetical protein
MPSPRWFVISLTLIVLTTGVAANGSAKESLLSVQLQGSGDFPIGKYAAVYGIGGTGGAHVRFILPFLPYMSIDADVDYGFNPFTTGQSMSRLAFRGGAGGRLPIWRMLEIFLLVEGGGYYGVISSDYGVFPTFNAAFSADAGIRLDLSVPISVAI